MSHRRDGRAAIGWIRTGLRHEQTLERRHYARALPDDQQAEAAALLLEFLEQGHHDPDLTLEQIAEIERRLSDDEPYATDDEVRAVYRRLSQ